MAVGVGLSCFRVGIGVVEVEEEVHVELLIRDGAEVDAGGVELVALTTRPSTVQISGTQHRSADRGNLSY